MSGLLFLERLTESDLSVLAAAAGGGSTQERVARLRADPARIGELLAHPEVHRALFGKGEGDAFVVASPFLVFSVMLARAARDLSAAPFVQEWVGAGRRLPVFDVAPLREFVDDPLRRLFLADLLGSYTHVSSAVVWTRSGRRLQRRRFSELDPVQLVQLAQLVPEHERLAVYRRLGDLALFMTGVFPDHATGRALAGHGLERVERALGKAPESDGGLGLLEWIGERAYGLVLRAAGSPRAGMLGALGEVARGFREARRTLNFLTDRYLFPMRERWFPPA